MFRARRHALVAGLAVLTLLASACGSSRTDEEFALAAQGIAAGGTEAAGAASPGADSPTAGDAGQTGTVPAPGTGTTAQTGGTTAPSGPNPGTTVPSGSSGGSGTPAGSGGSSAPAPAPPPPGAPPPPAPPGGQGGAGGATDPGAGAAGDGSPKSPIRIASVGALSGPAGAVLAPMTEAVQIWAAAVNARGGVNGHPVEVLVADDGGDPRRHREIVQDYVENQGVIAFVGNPSALSQQGSIDYLEQVQVPVVGTDGGTDFPYSRPIIRPQGASGQTLARMAANIGGQHAQERGLTRAGTLLCVEVATCQAVRPELIDVAPRYGMEVVYNGDASLTQPDFTAECLNASGAGVEILFVSLDAASLRRLAASCARQGFTPFYSTATTTQTNAVPTDPNLDGQLLTGSENPVWTDRSIPAVAEMLDAYATFAPGVEIQPTAIKGWTAGKLFEAAAAALPEPATAQDVIDGLNRITDNNLGGLTYPLTFREGQPAERVVCWFSIEIRDGRYVGANNNQISCE